MLEFILCVRECVFPPHNWIDKIFQDGCWDYDILTGSRLTRRLSVWGEAMLFQIRPNFWLSVCSGGHCLPKWTNIIQASPALWLQQHSSSNNSEWNAGNNALKLTIRLKLWKKMFYLHLFSLTLPYSESGISLLKMREEPWVSVRNSLNSFNVLI